RSPRPGLTAGGRVAILSLKHGPDQVGVLPSVLLCILETSRAEPRMLRGLLARQVGGWDTVGLSRRRPVDVGAGSLDRRLVGGQSIVNFRESEPFPACRICAASRAP